MYEKFRAGLANSTFAEYDNVRKLREEFITSGAPDWQITDLEAAMAKLNNIYMCITRPCGD